MKFSALVIYSFLFTAFLTAVSPAETLRATLNYEGESLKEIKLENEWALWEPLQAFLTNSPDGSMRVSLLSREWLLEKTGDNIRMTEGEQVNEGKTKDLLAEFQAMYSSSPLQVCEENLQNTKVACTMWFIDHQDLYPPDLDALVPEYFLRRVYCPISTGAHYEYKRAEDGKSFQATCLSDHGAENPSVTSDSKTEAQIRELKPED